MRVVGLRVGRGGVMSLAFDSIVVRCTRNRLRQKLPTRLRPLLLPKGFRCQRLNLTRNTQNHYYYQAKIKKKGGTCRICAC